jgi:hypothetical protein
MSVNVTLEPSKLLGMNWNMTQNTFIKFVVCPNIFEKGRVMIQVKNIVVTLDKYFCPVEMIQYKPMFPINEYIAQVIHGVIYTNNTIPIMN